VERWPPIDLEETWRSETSAQTAENRRSTKAARPHTPEYGADRRAGPANGPSSTYGFIEGARRSTSTSPIARRDETAALEDAYLESQL
jgi:hypothetical protein